MSQSDLEFTPQGPIAPETAAVLQAQRDIWQAAFNNRLNPDPATPQGQIMASLAAIVQDKNNQLLHLANMFNPATSDGIWQDALAAIYFITRQAAQGTAVQVVCTGLQGTVIAGQDGSADPARVKTTDGTVLVCQTGGAIPAGGSITLPFVALEPGPIEVEAHSVTTIVQAQPGWDTVDNPDPGVTGRGLESRQAFETRRIQSVALNSRSMLSSVYARVGALPGVIDLLARQNRTSAPVEINGVTLGPHSIYIAVLGGADAAIAEACAYYDVPREKLEIEIIEDAKTGIFGIVGARKAKIRARLATLPDFMQNPAAMPQDKPEKQEGRRRRNDRRREKSENTEAQPQKEETRENRRESRHEAEKDTAPAEKALPIPRPSAVPALNPQPAAPKEGADNREARSEEAGEAPRQRQPRQPRQSKNGSRKEAAPKNEEGDSLESTLPRVPLAELDQEKLTETTRTIISRPLVSSRIIG